MVGIGPFVPHHETPFEKEAGGTVRQTLYLLSLIRILKPDVLLPATTALGTIDPLGREKGVQAGANVVMPNLSPTNVRKKYELYDNKICTGGRSSRMSLLPKTAEWKPSAVNLQPTGAMRRAGNTVRK